MNKFFKLSEFDNFRMFITLVIAVLFFIFGIIICAGVLNHSIFSSFKNDSDIINLVGIILVVVSFLFSYAFIRLLFKEEKADLHKNINYKNDKNKISDVEKEKRAGSKLPHSLKAGGFLHLTQTVCKALRSSSPSTTSANPKPKYNGWSQCNPNHQTWATIHRIKKAPNAVAIPPAYLYLKNDAMHPDKLPTPLIARRTIPGMRKSEKGESLSNSTAKPRLAPLGSETSPTPPATPPMPMNT